MTVIDELLANNRAFAERFAHREHIDIQPSRRLAVVACMDSRLDVFAALGLDHGEAHVLRNAGGVITDDVIRSLAVSQLRLGTREILLIHHTDCGMETLTDDGFRAELQELSGMAPSFAIESFTDVDENVRQSIRRVRSSPFIPHREHVRGLRLRRRHRRAARASPRPDPAGQVETRAATAMTQMATIAIAAGQPPERAIATTAVASAAPPRTTHVAQRISCSSRRAKSVTGASRGLSAVPPPVASM